MIVAGLDDVTAAVQARADYLRCSTAAPESDGWIPCTALIDDPVRLRVEIEATAAGRGTSDTQVAASLFTQAYAFRVASIAVAAYALGLPGPATAPAAMAIRIVRHRPAELAVLDPSCTSADADLLASELLGGHLAPFIAAVRVTTQVGQRLLWGNVAASIATVFRAVQSDGSTGDAAVRERALRFERAADPWLRGLGHWSVLETSGALGWFWDRTSCCLWYRTEGGWYCDDCSLHDPTELQAQRLASLTGSRSA